MRLAVKTGAWTPTPVEWRRAVEIVESCEPTEIVRIMRLKIEEDRKRSLVGRLLLRHACSVHSGVEFDKVRLERTDRNKPICLDIDKGQVNISHHGDWVVLASDYSRCVGVDVMRHEEPRRGREAFFHSMQRQFTVNEWKEIDQSLHKFYRFWALKESYIKGIGSGLGFNLQRANFIFDDGENKAVVEIDGVLDKDWEFEMLELDEMHCVAVALGPPLGGGGIQQLDTTGTKSGFQILTVVDLLLKFGEL